MQTEIILSGFGGQGILFAGQVLAYAGLDQGKQVTWMPSYGPEMRGGAAHVTVILSDEEIGSPVVRHPAGVIALNRPAIEKYEPLVKKGGVLVYNCSLIATSPQRTDIRYVAVAASDIALELGEPKLVSLAALGAMAVATNILPLSALIQALYRHLPAAKRSLLEADEQALQCGARSLAATPNGCSTCVSPRVLTDRVVA